MSSFGSWCWWRLVAAILIGSLVAASMFVSAEANSEEEATKSEHRNDGFELHSPKNESGSGYKHVWPEMKFGWRIVVGTMIGFFGAACGSVGGIGGGGIYVPMLGLIIGFDPKSSAALSKCMVTGAAASTVLCNLRQKHPTLHMPVIDYDLALLFQPTMLLGISIGVALNVILPNWIITVLIIVLFTVMSTKSFLRGVDTWKKESIAKKDAAKRLELNGNGNQAQEYICEPESLSNPIPEETKDPKNSEVSILENIYWKELGLLVLVWVIILALQIAKNYTITCSKVYWLLDVLQIPVTGGVSGYEAVALYKGWRRIASKGEVATKWRVHQLILYCACGIMAGAVGGLLGLGGGFILGPLFLELGIPPQVSGATATFAMTFSASMSAVEYYLLKRFPVHYALYIFAVATIAAIVGQRVMRKLINRLGRVSIIIFTLSFTIFVSALSMGATGLVKMIEEIKRKEHMGFDNICSYSA